MFDVKKIWQIIIGTGFAALGGMARLLSKKDKSKLKWSLIFSELFISAFGGLMIILVARASGISSDWVGVICGVAGWTSPKILHAITKISERILGLEENELRNKRK